MAHIYNLKLLAHDTYAMAKFDADDFTVLAVYNLAPSRNGHFSCDCPANNRTVITKPCKHRRMLPLMLGAVNTDRFYNPDTGAWCEPLGDLDRPEAGRYGEAEAAEAPTEAPDLLKAIEPPEGLVGEALHAETPLVQGADRTATQIVADTIKTYEPVQRAAEAMLEPIVDHIHKLACKAIPPHPPASPPQAPIIRRR